MHIGHDRPLLCLCAVWMVAACVGHAWLSARGMLWAARVCLILFLLLSIALALRRGLRGISLRKQPRLLTAALALLCMGTYLLNTGLYVAGQVTPADFPSIATADSIEDTASEEGSAPDLPVDPDAPIWEVRAVVEERLSGGNQITGYGLTLLSVGETDLTRRSRPARAYLLCAYTADLHPGYEITLRAQAVELEEAADSMAANLRGDGYSVGLLVEKETDCTVNATDSGGLSVSMTELRCRLAADLEAAVGSEGGGLPSALLLGDRSALAPTLRRDFSRAGVSHLLAISGLHMTLLFGMLALLLKLLRLPRRIRAVLLGVSALGYLCLLGFPPSATRAVVMLGLVYLSWLCSASADPLTSLWVAGALIIGVSPCALSDAGFWMSFSSTLGLLTASYLLRQFKFAPGSRILRRVLAFLTGLFCGVVAMTFSLWITSLSIGTVSLWSPLATLLLTPLCGFVLAVSLLCLPLSGQWVGERILLPALRRVCSWMQEITAAMAEPTGAVVSFRQPRTETAIRVVILLMTVCLLLWLFLRLPRTARGWGLLPAAVGWVAILLLAELPARLYPDEILTSYIHETTSSEAIILTRGHEAVICDIGDGSRTSLNAALEEAEGLGATEISALMLTHYHTRMPGTLWKLLATATVRELWLPCPTSTDDYYRMLACLHEAELRAVPVRLYDSGDTLTAFGDSPDAGIALTLYTASLSRSVQPVLLLHIAGSEGSNLTFCGGGTFESELADRATALTAASETVIYGAHPPARKQVYPYVPSDRTESIVFADEATVAWLDPSSLPESGIPTMGIGGFRMILYTINRRL